MSRHDPLYDWTAQVSTQFPHLSTPQAAVLALWSFGIVLARSCTLPAVANILSPLIGRCYNTVRQRLREWYKAAPEKAGEHRRALDVTTCFAPLLAWILKTWPCPRVALALDATSLSDRLTVLSLSLVYRGTAIPVAWKVLQGNTPHAWKPEWLKLLQWFADQVDPTWTVIVMTDRGLYARWLFQAIVARGWHPMMRVTRLGKFLPEGGTRPREFGRFVPEVGRVWQGRGVAFPRKPERRLACTLLACWTEGHEDGWYVLTDLPPQAADAAWYGLRMWIEHGFEQFKSTGWQWQKTRMTAPDRAGRLWLAIALATLWVVAVGGEHDHNEGTQETMPDLPATDVHKRGPKCTGGKRLVSVFCQGIALILALLIKGQIPLPEKWYPEPWPGVEIHIQDREHEQPSKP
jgi:DDE family transposase